MRYYEILYIINPNFEKDKINNTMAEVTRKLEETKSKIINPTPGVKNDFLTQ